MCFSFLSLKCLRQVKYYQLTSSSGQSDTILANFNLKPPLENKCLPRARTSTVPSVGLVTSWAHEPPGGGIIISPNTNTSWDLSAWPPQPSRKQAICQGRCTVSCMVRETGVRGWRLVNLLNLTWSELPQAMGKQTDKSIHSRRLSTSGWFS